MSFSYLIRDLWKKQDERIKSLIPVGEHFSIDRALIFLPDIDWYMKHYKEYLVIGLAATDSWNKLCRELEYAIYDYYCDKKGKIMPPPYPQFEEFLDYILESGNVYFQVSYYDVFEEIEMHDKMIHGVRCTLPDGVDSLDWVLVDKLEAIAEKYKYYLF